MLVAFHKMGKIQILRARTLRIFSSYIFCLISPSVQASAPVQNIDLPTLVASILPSVVNISSVSLPRGPRHGWAPYLELWGVPEERPQASMGSGFLLESGRVLTNFHVIADADEVDVILEDKRRYRAKILGKDPKLDIAFLEIRDQERKIPSGLVPAKLGDSNASRIAETVIAIGNPFGLGHTVTTGIISAKNRTIGMGPLDNFIQTDAAINPGNSGGPLFNSKGEVIGVNTVIYSKSGQSGGVGFAIPIHDVKQSLPLLLQYGRVPRPWLGILGENMNPAMASYYQIAANTGVLIYNLVEQSPAQKLGFRVGDVITAWNNETVSTMAELEVKLTKSKPGDPVKITYRRGKKNLSLSIKLEEWPKRVDALPKGIL